MEVTHWKCYCCQKIGHETTFRTSAEHRCPVCASEDVFPHRIYQCRSCETKQDQHTVFGPDVPLDPDPETLGVEPLVCEECENVHWVQVPVTTGSTP